MQTEGLEHIGRPDFAAGTAIAVLGHGSAAGRRHTGHRRGDVEAIGPVATSATGIHQMDGGPLRWQRAGLAQHLGHRGQFLTVNPVGLQGHQQTTGEHRLDLAFQPALHQGRGLVGTEVITPKQLLEQLGPGRRARWGLGHGSALVQIRAQNGQKKARVQSTPGRVMGTLPLSPEEGEFGDLCSRIVDAALNERCSGFTDCLDRTYRNQSPPIRPWLGPAENPPPRSPGCARAVGPGSGPTAAVFWPSRP